MVLSANVPVAVKGCTTPFATDGLALFSAMESSRTTFTESNVEAVIGPSAALIVALPAAKPAAAPNGPIRATLGAEELQVTEAVKSRWLPSVKLPVALNGWTLAVGMVGLLGVTAIELSATLVTVNELPPVIEPDLALIWDLPAAKLKTTPRLSTVATAIADELQVTDVVMF